MCEHVYLKWDNPRDMFKAFPLSLQIQCSTDKSEDNL